MNFSGQIVCVVAPHSHIDSAVVRSVEEVRESLKSQGAAVLSPADLPYALDAVGRLDVLLAMVRASQVLVLLPGWGGCNMGRAAWAVASGLNAKTIYADRDKSGAIFFPDLSGSVGSPAKSQRS